MKKRRDDFVVQLEKAYAFPDDKKVEVNADPALFLPKMAAQLHLQVLESAVNGLATTIPDLVEQVLQRRENTARTEGEFYTMWPQLDRQNKAHTDAARALLGTIVANNPGIKRVDAMKQAGAAALVALGIPLEKLPVAPVAPPTFSPAAPGANGAPTPGRVVDTNPFTALSRELEEDLN